MNDELEGLLDEMDEFIRRAIDAETTSQTIEMLSGMTIEQVAEGFRDGELGFVDDIDEPEVTLDKAFEKISESYPMTKEEIWRHLEQVVAHGGKVTYGEPEVLSQEWIRNNQERKGVHFFVNVTKLQNLIVPKQEELETKIQELIEAYKQEEDAYSNPENGWISGFIEDLKNLVEKEQKYYILGKYDTPILSRDYRNRITETSNLNDIYPEANSEDFEFTEQEIKDYDPRYWAFAEPVK